MSGIFLDYYFSLLELLLTLFLAGAVGTAVFCLLTRRWRHERLALERKHAAELAMHDTRHFRELHNHLHSAVAHEFVKGLDYIAGKSVETLERLGDDQEVLRQKQRGIISQASELDQHAENILALFAADEREPQKELTNVRGLVEAELIKLFPFAQSKGVTLRSRLDDLEPTALNRNLALLSLKNVVHNAVKYSLPGGVVGVALRLEKGGTKGSGNMICVEVKDAGKGIRPEDQARIFELRQRGDGLVELGSGLGLYLARRAARLQGGDLVLVSSNLNQGSVFRISLPATGLEDQR